MAAEAEKRTVTQADTSYINVCVSLLFCEIKQKKQLQQPVALEMY